MDSDALGLLKHAIDTRYERRRHDDATQRAVAVIHVDPTGTIDYATVRAAELFGFDLPSDMEGLLVEELIPERFREKHRQHRAHFLGNGTRRRAMGEVAMQLVGLHRDGTEFPVEIELSLASIDDAENGPDHVIAVIILGRINERPAARPKTD